MASRCRYIDGNESDGSGAASSGGFVDCASPPAPAAIAMPGPSPILPWNPAEDRPLPPGYYHAKIALPSGNSALLIDIGAWTSVGGAQAAKFEGEWPAEEGWEDGESVIDEEVKLTPQHGEPAPMMIPSC